MAYTGRGTFVSVPLRLAGATSMVAIARNPLKIRERFTDVQGVDEVPQT